MDDKQKSREERFNRLGRKKNNTDVLNNMPAPVTYSDDTDIVPAVSNIPGIPACLTLNEEEQHEYNDLNYKRSQIPFDGVLSSQLAGEKAARHIDEKMCKIVFNAAIRNLRVAETQDPEAGADITKILASLYPLSDLFAQYNARPAVPLRHEEDNIKALTYIHEAVRRINDKSVRDDNAAILSLGRTILSEIGNITEEAVPQSVMKISDFTIKK